MITPLQPGDTLGLISPSSPMQPGRLELGIQYLTSLGFNVTVGEHVHDQQRFLAGRDEDRAADLMRFFKDPTVKGIMIINAGYGSQRILPWLDMPFIQAHPKYFIGFSDTTALQIGLYKQAQLPSYTGFTCRDLTYDTIDPLLEKTLAHTFKHTPYSLVDGETVIAGQAKGPLIAGNLSCLCRLFGTPYQPDLKGTLLLIEDLYAEPYMIDSHLSQLALAGAFDTIHGLIWGCFEQCHALQHPHRDGTVDDIIFEWSHRIGVPTLKNFPYGHQKRRAILPVGHPVKLNATERRLDLMTSP